VLEVRLSDTASGLGVFAKSTIEVDDTTALLEYEGEIYESATAFPAGASTEYVMEHKGDGTLIDSSGQQHEDKTARYINHAPAKSTASGPQANVEFRENATGQVHIYAICTILPQQELFADYGEFFDYAAHEFERGGCGHSQSST
jgi:hypothetical protein